MAEDYVEGGFLRSGEDPYALVGATEPGEDDYIEGGFRRNYGSEGGSGTFMVYPESAVDVIETWYSLRLPESFPLSNENWQVITQMKQTQPYVGDNEGHVILELEARQNQFQIITPWNSEGSPLWTCEATKERWIRFRWVVIYHHESGKGTVQLQVDDRAEATTWEPQHDSEGVIRPAPRCSYPTPSSLPTENCTSTPR